MDIRINFHNVCRYERDFFLSVVQGHGIVSWAAVDVSRSDGGRDKLVGFVTTRLMSAKESEVSEINVYFHSSTCFSQ